MPPQFNPPEFFDAAPTTFSEISLLSYNYFGGHTHISAPLCGPQGCVFSLFAQKYFSGAHNSLRHKISVVPVCGSPQMPPLFSPPHRSPSEPLCGPLKAPKFYNPSPFVAPQLLGGFNKKILYPPRVNGLTPWGLDPPGAFYPFFCLLFWRATLFSYSSVVHPWLTPTPFGATVLSRLFPWAPKCAKRVPPWLGQFGRPEFRFFGELCEPFLGHPSPPWGTILLRTSAPL